MVSRSKSKCFKVQKVQKYALNSQLQALQILTNDDEVENWSLSSFLLAVLLITLKSMIENFELRPSKCLEYAWKHEDSDYFKNLGILLGP